MDESEVEYGTLLFFRKDGQAGTPYSFCCGKTTIGASRDADIRLKLNNSDLKLIHCIIDVNEYGIATIVNKSATAPVKVNGNSVRIAKVLNHRDKIEVVGKIFQYLNEDLCEEDTEKCEQILREVISTSASPIKKRRSAASLVKSTKKTPNLKTKIPVRRHTSKRESFSGFSSAFTVTVTPRKRLGARSLLEKSQTTSKVIASKALSSPKPSKKRRLSLGGNTSVSKSSKVSARNILLSESTISSTTTECNELAFIKPSQTMKDVEEVKDVAGFLDESNITIDVQLENSSPVRKMSLKTPSRSSVKVTVTEMTPQANTPLSKRADMLDSSSKRISGVNSPRERSATFTARRLSINQPRTDTSDSQEEVTVTSDKSDLSASKRRSKSSNLSPNNTSRLSKGTKRKFSSMEDEDLSSEESVRLNLSSSSSVSPIKGFSQGSMCEDFNTGDNSSPRRSLLRKSIRKSQLAQENRSLAETSTNNSSKRSSVLTVASILDIRKSGLSPRRNNDTEEDMDDNPSSSSDSVFEEYESPSKRGPISRSNSVEAPSKSSFAEADVRKSLRRNSVPDKLSSEKSFSNFDNLNVSSSSSDSLTFLPQNSSPRRSIFRKSLRGSQQRLTLNEEESEENSTDTETEIMPKTRHSTGESLSFRRESRDFTDKSVRKSKQSIRNSEGAEEKMEENVAQSLEDDSIREQVDSSIEPDLRRSTRKRSTPYKFSLDKSSAKADVSNLSLLASPIPECISPVTPSSSSLRRSILKKSVRKCELKEEAELSSDKGRFDADEETPIRSRQSSGKKSQIGVSSAEPSARVSSTRSHIFLEEPESLNTVPIQDDFVNKSVRRTTRKSRGEKDEKMEKEMSLNEETIETTNSPSPMLKSGNMSDVKVLLTDCNVENSLRKFSVPDKLSPEKSLMESKTSLVEYQQDEDLSSEDDFQLVLSDGSREYFSPEKSLGAPNSTIQEELELETPKSALKSRRSKSTPYVPVTEDITPASPIAKEKIEGGFKTPLNTPGLFENIRESVMKSRSRTHKSSSSFMDELNKAGRTKAVKRARESTNSSVKSTKRRKIVGYSQESSGRNSQESDFNFSSFDSFRTEDILSDISDENVLQTPKHFSDLTDKPVVNVPRTRSLTEPRNNKPAPTRRSLHAIRLESQLTTVTGSSNRSDVISATSFSSEHSDSVFEISSDSDVGARSLESKSAKRAQKKRQNSPKNDLSDVAGLKKLLRTPRQVKSPKNDLSDVRGVKNILQTPKTVKAPKNDLENIVSFKKLLKTPREVKTPKNDLTDVRGVKKLLETPKTIKSPKNDLTNIPSLRNLMSPKTAKSPKNDLKNIVSIKRLFETPKVVKSPKNDLSNVAGVKKLLSTPVAQNSPKNDLTNVPNLRRIMTPRQQNSPRNDLTTVRGVKRLMKTPKKVKEPINDLSNVEDVANIFNVSVSNKSDIENNDDLFDKLFVKKPLKTYRGRSMSPTTRKVMLYKGDRKTLGDTPVSSPRVEKWVEEQAVMKSKTEDDVFEKATSEQEKCTTKKPSRKQKRAEELEKVETDRTESPKRLLRGRRKAEKHLSDSADVDIKTESPKTTSRRKAETKHVEKLSEVVDTKDADKVMLAKRTLRGRRNVEEQEAERPQEVKETIKSETPKRTKRGRKNVEEKRKENRPLEIVKIGETDKVESPKRTLRGRRNIEEKYPSEVAETNESWKHPSEVVSAPKTTRGKKKVVKVDDESSETIDSTLMAKPAAKRGRSKKAALQQDDQVAEVDSTTSEITASPAPRRGRTRVATMSEEVDESTDTEMISVAPKRGRRRNATKEEKDSSTEKTPVKRTIGKAQEMSKMEEQKAELKENEPVEQVAAEPERPVKATRGRPKKSTKQVELEPAPEKAVNKRTRKAVEEEEVVTDSPRTRAKKGDFNKYGDEFVVQSPRLESKTKKKVQFEDETDDDQAKTRKLRGRNVDTLVEETTRRSKRTRK